MESIFRAGANGRIDPRTGTRTDSDTGSFRRLLDDELSPEEYIDQLDERVRERREAEETAQDTEDRESV